MQGVARSKKAVRPRAVPGVDDLADWPAAAQSLVSKPRLALCEDEQGVPGDSVPVPGVHILTIKLGSSCSASSCG